VSPTDSGGLVLADKAVGPSSFATVSSLRRRYGTKAGHAGTLDPRASGLLLVLLGRATRLARYLVGLDKRYLTAIRLGLRTTSGDAEGDELEETEIPLDIEAALAALRGEVELRVPAASAVRIDGARAYHLYRSGVPVEMPVRRSVVEEIRVRRFDGAELELDLHVQSGTYVRSIADALGGHCVSLRRTAVGPFTVADADEETVLAPLNALPFLPQTELSESEEILIRTGRSIQHGGDGPVRLVRQGHLVAVAQAGGGVARPETVLA
jgi:tRNA pseudouridine55 synthase